MSALLAMTALLGGPLAARPASAATPTPAARGVLNVKDGIVNTDIEVSVNGGPKVAVGVTTLRYGLVAQGNYQVEVFGGSGADLGGGTVAVTAGDETTALIYRISGTKIVVRGILDDAPATLLPTQSLVQVTDAAEYTRSITVTLNGTAIGSNLTDSSAPVSRIVPAGEVNFTVTDTLTGHTLLTFDGHILLAGYILQIFVVGSPSKGTMTVADAARTVGIGYRLYAADGGVFNFGDTTFFGSLGDIHLNKPIVGAAPDNLGIGYWMVASDGGVFTFGDAGFFGSTGNIHLNKPVVAMAPTPDGNGYWLVASDGGIFTFGDAKFYGSLGNVHLHQPIVGMAATPNGKGYWLVAADGGIFTFGDAGFFGSTGAIPLHKPIVGMAPTLDGNGYWLVASDGGIFTFGDAAFYGSTGDVPLHEPVVGMFSTPDSLGYYLVASDGGIFTFGDAKFYGSTGDVRLHQPILAGTLGGSPFTD
jgi:hypothetical protein